MNSVKNDQQHGGGGNGAKKNQQQGGNIDVLVKSLAEQKAVGVYVQG